MKSFAEPVSVTKAVAKPMTSKWHDGVAFACDEPNDGEDSSHGQITEDNSQEERAQRPVSCQAAVSDYDRLRQPTQQNHQPELFHRPTPTDNPADRKSVV